MSGSLRESTIIHLEETSSNSNELHFPAGIKPFEPIPRTEDNTDIDYYAVLAIQPDASENDIRAAQRNMFMFYHPDRRDRVFADYVKPDGFDEQCDIIFNTVVQAKDTLLNDRKRINYNFLHFSQEQIDRRITYQDDRQEALETIQNMRMSAMLIEEGEIKKGYKGLVIIEAYYGAIENIVDPNVSIEDIAFGRVLDVKIPLLCQIEDSKIFHKKNGLTKQQSLSSLPGFFDCCVGENKRLFVRYRFMNHIHIMNVGEFDDFGLPQRRSIHTIMLCIGHRVRLPGEIENEDANTQNVQKHHIDKENDRTYSIIMNDKPRHRFHLRYVVYTAGVFLGFGLLYKYNPRFRLSCQKLVLSYRCGQLYQDVKSYFYNTFFKKEDNVKKGIQAVTDRYHDVKSKILDADNTKHYCVWKKQKYCTNYLSCMCENLVS